MTFDPAISEWDNPAASAVIPAFLRGHTGHIGESNKGRMADALAHGGDEGRDKLR